MNTEQKDKNIFIYKLTMIMNTEQTKTFLCITLTFIKSSNKFYYAQPAQIMTFIKSSNKFYYAQPAQIIKP